MSTDDTPLEGDDPRVLQKIGETVYTTTDPARSGPRYHATEDCRKLDKALNTTERDRAVAEWQGCKPCSVCHEHVVDNTTSPLDSEDVDAARVAILDGQTPREVAVEFDVSDTTIRKVIRDADRGDLTPPLRFNNGAREWQRVEVDR